MAAKTNILVIVNSSNEEAAKAAKNLETYCESRAYNFIVRDGWEITSIDELDQNNFDLAVVFGGDGTMLRTSRIIGNHDIPILGINYGNLGFLTNSSEAGVEKLVEAALNDELKRESRCHLIIDVQTNKQNVQFIAMNEATIRRSKSGRIVDFSININDEHVCDLRSDGVIASSATGSTAYALAAGGPLVAPTFKGVIIVPLAPHTLNSRPLVTSKKDNVEFDFSRDDKDDQLEIAIDGEIMSVDGKILKVEAKADTHETTILRIERDTFYSRISKVFF